MSYLLYCIFRRPIPAALQIPDGLGGARVFTSNYRGLGVALSKSLGHDSSPDASKLLAYERVVESFYRHLTVIPLRYGYRVACPYDAVNLLRENFAAYDAHLRKLEGLAEMSIQLLLDTQSAATEGRLRPGAPDPFGFSSYLPAHRQGYQSPQGAGLEQRDWVKELCDSLDGSFVRHKVEFPSSRKSRQLSLHFLVPRDSVEAFREAARHLSPHDSVKLLFSGPLPPYNFVDTLPSYLDMQGATQRRAVWRFDAK